MTVRLVRRPRARRWTLRYDGRQHVLCLSVPPRGSVKAALDWAAGQGDWLDRILARRVAHQPLDHEATIPFQGVPHRIIWSEARPRRVEKADGVLLVGGDRAGIERRVLRWLREQARHELSTQSSVMAVQAGRVIRSVGVGDPRTRWGSCTASGAIRYSWRLILAPPEVLTATVAHEVAHLVHMHHGPEFHALVATLLGREPKAERAWLRQHGVALHAIGAGAAVTGA